MFPLASACSTADTRKRVAHNPGASRYDGAPRCAEVSHRPGELGQWVLRHRSRNERTEPPPKNRDPVAIFRRSLAPRPPRTRKRQVPARFGSATRRLRDWRSRETTSMPPSHRDTRLIGILDDAQQTGVAEQDVLSFDRPPTLGDDLVPCRLFGSTLVLTHVVPLRREHQLGCAQMGHVR
jgi:hypothetical protein